MADPTIEQPVSSGATDQPNAPQSGAPTNTPTPPPLPEGASYTGPQPPPLPEGASYTEPQKTPPGDKPGFVSSLYSDVGQIGENLLHTVNDTLAYKPPSTDVQKQLESASEQHKHDVYQQVKNDLHSGNYAKAFSNLTNLFDPHYDDPNDPISKVLTAQWDSSKLAKKRMMEAVKNKDYAAVVQHAAGILPVASQVDSAMENFGKDPSRENLAHIVSTAIQAFVPSLMRGAKYVYENLPDFPTRAGNEGAVPPPEPSLNPKETAIQKAVERIDLPEGQAGQAEKTVEIPPTEDVTSAPTGTMHEPILQNSVRSKLNDLAKTEGLKPIGDDVDLRDIGKNLSDQFYARSKAGFDQIKEATGIDLNVLKDQLRDLYEKKSETFDSPEKEGAIIEKINNLEEQADTAIADAKKAGINTDKPLIDWKKSKAASDLGEQLRSSTDIHQKSGTLDPGKFVSRLEKLYRSNPKFPNQPGRLQQLIGDTAADTMRDDAYAADETNQAIKNFKPTKTKTPGSTTTTPEIPATESKALYDIVRKNTSRRFGIFGEKTNWVKTYQDFDNLTPAERSARFSNPSKVEEMLLKQAKGQRFRAIGTGLAATAIAHTFGVDSYVIKKLIGE